MLTKIESLPVIQSPLLQSIPWLTHGFGIKDIPLEQYLEVLQTSEVWVPKTKQTHGNAVHYLGRTTGGVVLEGDAFLTDETRVICFVRTADCLPLLLVDVEHRAIGAVHAGWRGSANKVVLSAVTAMQKKWKTDLKNLKVALGPAIGGHCYLVREDVKEAFEKAKLYPGPWMEEIAPGRWFLDIAFANLFLLEQTGVLRKNIYLSLACTACDLEHFHSFRKEGDKEGEQFSFVLIQNPEEK